MDGDSGMFVDRFVAYSASMNSNVSLTMILGEVRGGFFQELVLHTQLTRFAIQLPEPGAFGCVQLRFVAGMLTPVPGDPTSQCAFLDTEFFGYLRDRTRRLDHQLHRFFTIFGRIILFRTRQGLPFQTGPILLGPLSGKLGAPQGSSTSTSEPRKRPAQKQCQGFGTLHAAVARATPPGTPSAAGGVINRSALRRRR
jgi:hypothetical protein